MKSMVLLEALFSFLYRSSTASSILTTLDAANLIKKYVVPKYPKGLGIDTKLWHKGMRRLLYLLLSNYDEIFVSSSASRNTTRAPPRVPPVTTTTREPEEREYEIESKRNRTKRRYDSLKRIEEVWNCYLLVHRDRKRGRGGGKD